MNYRREPELTADDIARICRAIEHVLPELCASVEGGAELVAAGVVERVNKLAGIHRMLPLSSSGGAVLERFRRMRCLEGVRLRDVAAAALADGWRFFVRGTQGHGRQPVKGVSRIVAVHMAAPLALWMEREGG